MNPTLKRLARGIAIAVGALVLVFTKPVALRSRLLVQLSGAGGMVSLACGLAQAHELVAPSGDRLNIAAVNGVSAIVVSGEVNTSKDITENGYVHRERHTGKFSRTLPLPSGTKPEDIKASMEHGVLSITFPKTSPEQAPQKITIA